MTAAVAPRGLTRADLMTAGEVAQLLDVPISTVREWGRNGTLPRVKLGRHVRFSRVQVETAILSAAEAPSSSRDSGCDQRRSETVGARVDLLRDGHSQPAVAIQQPLRVDDRQADDALRPGRVAE